MKRMLTVFVCLALLMGLMPAARAAGVTEVMCVYNCQEWVSLREAPDTKSTRLEKVHLGELVTNCKAAGADFIQCEFNGKTGYIQYQYLKMTDFSAGESFPGNQMVVNCSEWVSLWSAPDTSSKRLDKVPLGTIVTACVAWYDSFICCEYKGQRGYIARNYLKAANYGASSQDPKVVDKNEGKFPEITGPMVVVNCNEWVSLREKASPSSARLAKVPLGTLVYDCVQVSETFVYCSYNGLWGYIQLAYLSEPESDEPEWEDIYSTFSTLPSLPDYDAFMSAGSTLLLSQTFAGYTIAVRQAFNEVEEMMAVCYDLNWNPLWELRGKSEGPLSDVVQTDAFVGGVTEDALLIWYIQGKGFFAYEFGPQPKQRWALPDGGALGISNSIQTAVHYDGTIYAAYDDKLLCISREGALLWQVSCDDPGICFPVGIAISEDCVEVSYENHPELTNVITVVQFSKNGAVLSQTMLEISPDQ